MKIYILTTLLFFNGILAAQQADTSKQKNNQLFIELFGNAYLYSLNYERYLYKKNKIDISARVGLSYYYSLHNATYFPISLQGYYGGKSKLEVGVGYLPIFRWNRIKEEGTIFNFDKGKYTQITSSDFTKGHDEPYADGLFVNIGYHQELKKNFLFKISFSPWIVKGKNVYGIIPWGRIAFGKTF